MAFLQQQLNYKEMAEKYSKHSDAQFMHGKKFVEALGIALGDKVLDVGCGTGEIAAYVADTVKEDGLCVGFDPDKYRIEVAMEKHLPGRTNITFFHGDSSSKFPHANEEFYDYVLCLSVFNWMNESQKLIFLKAAYDSLRPGGKLAIFTLAGNLEIGDCTRQLFTNVKVDVDTGKVSDHLPKDINKKQEATELLPQYGFVIQSERCIDCPYQYKTLDDYLTWVCASAYLDKQKILPDKLEKFAQRFQNEDGTVPLNIKMFEIVATKPEGN
ncbi:uncharacterized protein LOC124440522 [Xenia sp. Carnegie-2017]|uniref:uncharacterized protein LOC124440522 n=1 Tax=Xenia sp. Carnegie-2017 TaxID=2897299 RepID=UPI001F048DC9|nr:uncharacterized protein LOC124440522 [Xenia sp. Carnegie-2017]